MVLQKIKFEAKFTLFLDPCIRKYVFIAVLRVSIPISALTLLTNLKTKARCLHRTTIIPIRVKVERLLVKALKILLQ